MALSLDPTLAAAQDSQSRRPIIEIISSDFAEDIPFDGQLLTDETTNEQGPNLIRHSTGRLCLVYKYGTNQIKYVYTDTARTTFSFVTLTIAASHTIEEAAVCELANGNIGILYRTSLGASDYLKYKIVTVTGTAVSSGDIATYSESPDITGPAVIRLADNSYLAVYVRLNGTDYTFYKRTSSNFTAWSAASAMSVGGLTATSEIANPFLLQITTGDIFLWFDYVDGVNFSNIYYSISADNGSTWGSAVKVTSYADASTKARHPVSAQKIAGQLYMIFNEESSAIRMDTDTFGWCGTYASGTDIAFDPASRKLYVTSVYTGGGTKILSCVVEIDVDTWTISSCWGSGSTPAFHSVFFNEYVWWQRWHGEQYLIPVGTHGEAPSRAVIAVLDAQADTITNYCFGDWAAYGLTGNVDHDLTDGSLQAAWIDANTRRLYALFAGENYNLCWVGYIDLTEPGPVYHWTTIVDGAQIGMQIASVPSDMGFAVYPGSDTIIVWNEMHTTAYKERMKVFQLSSGSELKDYNVDDFPAFPYHGVTHCVLVGNIIYCGFEYEPLYSQQDKRGLCAIDTVTDTITFKRPDWASIDDYQLETIHPMPDGRLLIATEGYGITIFDPATETWEIFNNTTLPGMEPAPSILHYASVIYDEDAGMIYGGTMWVSGYWRGVIAFSEYGFLKRSHYMVGNYSGGWNWGDKIALVRGFLDYDLAAVFGPEAGDGLIVFWTNFLDSETSVKWDKEGLTLNFGDYLARGREISIHRSIGGNPNELKFTVSHGHLFDPDNLLSLLRPMLEKGRKITVRMGERIADVDYWANQGIFVISDVKLRYQRGSYPEMEVTALDRRLTWDHAQIIATEPFNTDPRSILINILVDHLGFTVGQIDLPVFDTAVDLSHQWVECLAKDVIAQICNRFGYFPRMTVDGKLSARKISDANSVDHVYSDNTKLINFTPDDSFSDFVNQIIVIGQEATEIDMVYAEERIETINGTIGWWKRKKDYRIYYSKDMSRRCRNPRLVVLESSSGAPFNLGGRVSESISYEDPLEFYCDVTIEGPDLAPMLVAAIATIVGAYLLGDLVVSLGKGWTVPVGRYIQMLGVVLCLQTLASVCNFQLEIWARPLGKVKRSLQGKWEDTDLQTKIGAIVPWKIEEPLCTSVPECTEVATQEGLEKQLQRRRRKFTKVAHLQDEEGDTLQFPHPYTGTTMSLFVTEITRKMMIPEQAGGEGYFLDEIEGWKL